LTFSQYISGDELEESIKKDNVLQDLNMLYKQVTGKDNENYDIDISEQLQCILQIGIIQIFKEQVNKNPDLCEVLDKYIY